MDRPQPPQKPDDPSPDESPADESGLEESGLEESGLEESGPEEESDERSSRLPDDADPVIGEDQQAHLDDDLAPPPWADTAAVADWAGEHEFSTGPPVVLGEKIKPSFSPLTPAASVIAIGGLIICVALIAFAVRMSDDGDSAGRLETGTTTGTGDEPATTIEPAAETTVTTGITTELSASTLQTQSTEIEPDGDEPSGRLQAELDQLVAVTPISFAIGQSDLTEEHKRVLDQVATSVLASEDARIAVIGYVNLIGSEDANRELSRTRAENVLVYLVSRGVPEQSLVVETKPVETSASSETTTLSARSVALEVQPPEDL